jgi:hypothetical protein
MLSIVLLVSYFSARIDWLLIKIRTKEKKNDSTSCNLLRLLLSKSVYRSIIFSGLLRVCSRASKLSSAFSLFEAIYSRWVSKLLLLECMLLMDVSLAVRCWEQRASAMMRKKKKKSVKPFLDDANSSAHNYTKDDKISDNLWSIRRVNGYISTYSSRKYLGLALDPDPEDLFEVTTQESAVISTHNSN